jgi:hypothetical protein
VKIEDAFHLPLVVHVLGEDVLVERVARAAVDEQVAVLAVAAGPLGQELPALLAHRAGLAGRFELLPRPEDGPLGGGVEPVRVEHRALVVVAQEHQLAVHHQVDALARVGAVPDHVSEAVDLADAQRLDVGQHGLEGFQVPVDVADDRLHAGLSTGRGRTAANVKRSV